MEKRILGKTGESLSIVGFGGIIVAQESQADANNYVAEALDCGVNYFDVAPTYFDAEDRLGPALQGKREKIFLACKTEDRTKAGSERLLHESLRKLKTDHFDLYQFHAVSTLEDVEKIFGPDGAMETFLKARQEGVVRHLGFSAHSEEAAHAMLDRFDFDTILFPINWVNILNGGFAASVIERAHQKGMGILAIKAMAKTAYKESTEKKYPKAWYEAIDEKELAKRAYRYTLSKPVTAAVPPGDIEHFRWAVEAVQNFSPMTSEEEASLAAEAKKFSPLFPLV